MASSPNPQPKLPDLGSLVAGVANSDKTVTGEYGLNKDAATHLFDTTGLPGLATGPLAGNDLLNAFLSAGQSSDPLQAGIVAAIQHSLLYAGYYSGSYTPNFGVAKKQDAEALAAAVNDQFNANKARPDTNRQTLAQWLSGQAAVGATSGSFASQAAAPTVVNIRAPNAADVAAVYQKVASQVLGHKPDAAETAAFVQNYTQSYVANEKANVNAQYDATVQKAQIKQQQKNTPTPPVAPSPALTDSQTRMSEGDQLAAGIVPGGPAQTDSQTRMGVNADGTPATPASSLTDSMLTLQDIINQRSQAAQSGASPGGVIYAGTNAAESPDVAAQNFARNTHPHDAAAADLNSTFGQFLQLLSGKIG